MKWNVVLAFALAGVAATAGADTLYLNTGVSIDGIVTERSDGLYEVRIGDRTVVYRPSEVRSVERNDRTGTFDREAAEARWEAQRRELEERTGLNVEQRRRVDALLAQLRRDGAARVRARDQIVALADEINVQRYLEVLLGESAPTLKPWLLDALFIIAPQQTLPVLREHLKDNHYATRVKAIELLGDAGDRASAGQIARGLADAKIEVRLAAAVGLAQINAREATPALIESMKHADIRVSNSSRDALNALWHDRLGGERLTTVDEWNDFYRRHGSDIASPIRLASLEPLIQPEYELVIE